MGVLEREMNWLLRAAGVRDQKPSTSRAMLPPSTVLKRRMWAAEVCPGGDEHQGEDDGGAGVEGAGEQKGDAGSGDGAGHAGDAAAEGAGPLRTDDEQSGHGAPVAVAQMEVSIERGAEQEGEDEAEGVPGGFAAEVEVVAELREELIDALAEAGNEGGGFGAVVAAEGEVQSA
jgi:hypothetical protein